MTDLLSRQVLIHVCANGQMYYRERGKAVFASVIQTTDGTWHEVAADALREHDVERAKTLIASGEAGLYDDEEQPEPEGELGLPVFSVDTVDDALQVLRQFGTHVPSGTIFDGVDYGELLPDGQEVYICTSFSGRVEDLWPLGERIAKWWHVKQNWTGAQTKQRARKAAR